MPNRYIAPTQNEIINDEHGNQVRKPSQCEVEYFKREGERILNNPENLLPNEIEDLKKIVTVLKGHTYPSPHTNLRIITNIKIYIIMDRFDVHNKEEAKKIIGELPNQSVSQYIDVEVKDLNKNIFADFAIEPFCTTEDIRMFAKGFFHNNYNDFKIVADGKTLEEHRALFEHFRDYKTGVQKIYLTPQVQGG